MGISIIPQGGLAISVYPTGLLAPRSDQTVLYFKWFNTDSATTLYTVPAGKTLYITCISLGSITAPTATDYNLQSDLGAWLYGVIPSQAGGNVVINGGVLGVFPTGCRIILNHSFGAGKAWGHMVGWLQ